MKKNVPSKNECLQKPVLVCIRASRVLFYFSVYLIVFQYSNVGQQNEEGSMDRRPKRL